MLTNFTCKFIAKHIRPYEPGQTEERCIEDAIRAHNGRNIEAGKRTGIVASDARISTILFVKTKYEDLLNQIVGGEIRFMIRSTYHVYTEKYIRKAVTVEFDRITNEFICTVISRPLGFSFGAKDGQCAHYEALTTGARHPIRTSRRSLYRGPVRL